MTGALHPITVRNTRAEDFDKIIQLTREVYPGSPPWAKAQLESHLRLFPEGQLVAEEAVTGRIMGMAASLILFWDDYEFHTNWRELTSGGYFTNHEPGRGRTLYGAEVMVQPDSQRRGIGKKLYQARRELTRSIGLCRIRAGARLRGYHRYAQKMTPEEYVIEVIHGRLRGPTLSFQLREGFDVVGVVSNYLEHDAESQGYAAVIEWLNDEVALPEDRARRDHRFDRPEGAR